MWDSEKGGNNQHSGSNKFCVCEDDFTQWFINGGGKINKWAHYDYEVQHVYLHDLSADNNETRTISLKFDIKKKTKKWKY